MANSRPVELDFFRMERQNSTPSSSRKPIHHSLDDVERELSQLHPDVLNSIFESSDVDRNNSAFGKKVDFSASDIGAKKTMGTSMTIFYNGKVSVFNVPQHDAEIILQIAQQGFSDMCIDQNTSLDRFDMLQGLTGDLPIARRKSLKYFLEKRKERVTMVSSPYGCPFPNQKSSGRSALSLSLSYKDNHNPISM